MWVPRNRARERDVERALGLVTDARATQYWDEHKAVLEPYHEMFRLTGPCAGVFMLFDRDARWEDTAPIPSYAEDAHARELDRDLPQWNAERFAKRVEELVKQ